MNKLLFSIASMLVSMATEIMLRRINKHEDADKAEESAIQAAVTLGVSVLDQMKLPVYLVPLKMMLLNHAVIAQLAKFLFDQVEDQMRSLLNSLDEAKLAQLKSDIA